MNILLDNSIVRYGTKSNRRLDENGYLHVTDCILTSAIVSDYKGHEIADYKELGLDPEGIYGVLRPLEELKKGLLTYNGLPLLDKHIPVSSQQPQQSYWLGCIGTDARIDGDDVLNTITIWKQTAIDAIQKADKSSMRDEKIKKDLSCGYGYKLVQESGEFKGKKYHFKMVDLKGNHVALVEDGRVPDAMIADNNIIKKGNRMKANALSILFGGLFGDKMAVDNNHIISGIKQLADKSHEDYEGGEVEQAKGIIELAKKIKAEEKSEMSSDKKRHKGKAHDDEEEMEMDKKKHHKKKMHDDDDEDKKHVKDNMKYEGKNSKNSKYEYVGDDDDEDDDCMDKKHKKHKANDKDNVEYHEMRDDDDDKAKDKKHHKGKAHDSMDTLIKKEFESRQEVYKLCTKVIGKLSNELAFDSCENIIDNTLKAKNVNIDGKSYDTKLGIIEFLAGQTANKSISRMAQDNNTIRKTSDAPQSELLRTIKGSK